MAVRFVDGFDHYVASPEDATTMFKKWTGAIGSSPVAGGTCRTDGAQARTLGGQCLNAPGGFGSNAGIYKTIGTPEATLIAGCAIKFTANQPSGISYLFLCDGSTAQVSVQGDAVGHLVVVRGGPGSGTVLATSTFVITLDVWYYIELKATIDPAAGVIQLRVNGADWIPSTGSLNTRVTGNSSADGVGLWMNDGGVYWDDLYVADTTGGVNDDFLGPQVVQVLRPVGPGNYAQWTPNFGANNGNVQDMFPDGDQTFNENSTPGNIDSFEFEDVFMSSGAIAAVQHVIYARQDAGAQRTVSPLQRSSGVDYAGTAQATAGSYVYLMQVDDVNPDTGAAWDVAGLNAAEFGYELVS